MFSWLPTTWAARCSVLMGNMLWRISGKRRNTTIKNLEVAYPDLSEREMDKLGKESAHHYMRSGFELGMLWYWPVNKIMDHIVDVQGLEHLEAAKDHGKGVIIAAPHFGAWEILGLYLQSVADMAILYKPPDYPGLDDVLIEKRARGGATVIPVRAIRKLYQHLRSGGAAGVLPDQQPSLGDGRFAPLYGVPALTATLVPRLVQKMDCRVVFSICERLKDGKYRVYFIPAEEDTYNADNDLALAALNRGVETCIDIAPEQYLWSYKRYKTRPEGEPSFYSSPK